MLWGWAGDEQGFKRFAHSSLYPANGFSLFSVERENVQKRTFTRWVNLHLEKVSGARGFLLSDRFLRDRAHSPVARGGGERVALYVRLSFSAPVR